MIFDALEVSRAAYDASPSAAPSTHAARDAELEPMVLAIFWHPSLRYDAPPIANELADPAMRSAARCETAEEAGLRAQRPESFMLMDRVSRTIRELARRGIDGRGVDAR